jgi:hypothetical protein
MHSEAAREKREVPVACSHAALTAEQWERQRAPIGLPRTGEKELRALEDGYAFGHTQDRTVLRAMRGSSSTSSCAALFRVRAHRRTRRRSGWAAEYGCRGGQAYSGGGDGRRRLRVRLSPRGGEHDQHPHHADRCPEQVPAVWLEPVHEDAPRQRQRYEHPAVGDVDPSELGDRLQGGHQAVSCEDRRAEQGPRKGLVLPQPPSHQVAAAYLAKARQHEQPADHEQPLHPLPPARSDLRHVSVIDRQGFVGRHHAGDGLARRVHV